MERWLLARSRLIPSTKPFRQSFPKNNNAVFLFRSAACRGGKERLSPPERCVSTPFFGRLSIHLDRTGFKPPHLFSKIHTRGRVWQKMAALVPLIAIACFAQGWPAMKGLCVAVCGAMIAEALGAWLFRRLAAYQDGESILIGLLCALILPHTLSVWVFFAAAFIAVFAGREIFGGFGQAVIFPPAAGLLTVFLGLPQMLQAFDFKHARSLAEGLAMNPEGSLDLKSLFFYPAGVTVAEASLAALAVGIFILLKFGLVRWELPVLCAAGISSVRLMLEQTSPLFLLSGGFWLVLFWGMTQTSALPLTLAGRRVYALLAGFLTAACPLEDEALRLLAGLAAASLAVPWIDGFLAQRRDQEKEGA